MVSAEAKVLLVLRSQSTAAIQPKALATAYRCSSAEGQFAKVAASIWQLRLHAPSTAIVLCCRGSSYFSLVHRSRHRRRHDRPPMAGVFSMSFIRRWARSRAQRAESTWTACGLCDGADYRCTRRDASNRAGRQAVEDSSMGTRVCAGHWKEEERRQEYSTAALLRCCTAPRLMHVA